MDRLGNENKEEALAFQWLTSDIDKANWSNMTGYMTLDLAHPIIVTQEGLRSLGMWCTSESGQLQTPRLCGEPYEAATRRFQTRLTK